MAVEEASVIPSPGQDIVETKGLKDKAAPSPAVNVASPARQRRALEPSLQAWAASRQLPLQPCNVGASEVTSGKGGLGKSLSSRSLPKRSSSRQGRKGTNEDQSSARSQGSADEQSRSLSKGWNPKVTVPRGPYLRTAERARSRSASASSSRQRTPENSPSRSRSTTPNRAHLPASEQIAVEHYLQRMANARHMSESPARVRLAFGTSVDRSAPSPARSVSADSVRSRTSDMSNESRRSHMSRPKTFSKHILSSEEVTLQRAEEEQRAIKAQMRKNETSYKEAILNPFSVLSIRDTQRTLTVPKGPELVTPLRASRDRSTSWHGARNKDESEGRQREWLKSLIPREQAAVEQHLDRAEAGATGLSRSNSRGNILTRSKQGDLSPEVISSIDGMDVERWIQEAPSAEERAQRARAAALGKREAVFAQERSRLCVFKSTGGMKVASAPAKEVEEAPEEEHELN